MGMTLGQVVNLSDPEVRRKIGQEIDKAGDKIGIQEFIQRIQAKGLINGRINWLGFRDSQLYRAVEG